MEGNSLRGSAKKMGIPFTTFENYKRRGIVTPDIPDKHGKLTLYSDEQIKAAKAYRAAHPPKKEKLTENDTLCEGLNKNKGGVNTMNSNIIAETDGSEDDADETFTMSFLPIDDDDDDDDELIDPPNDDVSDVDSLVEETDSDVLQNSVAESSSLDVDSAEENPRVISGATYRTILLHAEKITNGQYDFAAVLKKELRDLLDADAENLIEELVNDPPDFIKRVKIFLAQFPFIVEEDNGARYQLINNELELVVDGGAKDETPKNSESNINQLAPKITVDEACVKDLAVEEHQEQEAEKEPYENSVLEDNSSESNNCKTEPTVLETAGTTEVKVSSLEAQTTIEEPVEVETASSFKEQTLALTSDGSVLQESTSLIAPMSNVAIETPPFFEDVATPLAGKSLQELAKEGRMCFERGNAYLKQGVMYYIEGGRRLAEAKRRLKHGQWQPWLKGNFQFSQDTASNYMKLAERFGDSGDSNSELIRNLGYTRMVKLLALRKGDEKNFVAAQKAVGKPIESQSAREIQKAVKEWNSKDDDEIGGSYFNATGSEKNDAVVEEMNNSYAGLNEPCESIFNRDNDISRTSPENPKELISDSISAVEVIGENTSPASLSTIDTVEDIVGDFQILSEKDIAHVQAITDELTVAGNPERLKIWHNRLVEFAQELEKQVSLVKSKLNELFNDETRS